MPLPVAVEAERDTPTEPPTSTMQSLVASEAPTIVVPAPPGGEVARIDSGWEVLTTSPYTAAFRASLGLVSDAKEPLGGDPRGAPPSLPAELHEAGEDDPRTRDGRGSGIRCNTVAAADDREDMPRSSRRPGVRVA